MGKKLQKRCMFCARVFDDSHQIETGKDFTGETPKSICPLCEARLKKEAEDMMKNPKPM
ncbi:MAG: hypothetical protein ACOX6X_01570 [Dethiobacteria bacterium]|jgi:rRNA maturation endonuclease Nob1